MNWQDRQLQLVDRRKAADARAIDRAEAAYRKAHQGKETRREWDLNDPAALKAEQPLGQYKGDADVRFGPSSMQYFEGEDSGGISRTDLQRQQVREWTSQAASEKAATAAAQAEADRQYVAYLATQRKITEQAEQQNAAAIRAQAHAHSDMLIETIQQKAGVKATLSEAEQMANHQDQLATINSKLLSEDPGVAFDQSGRLVAPNEFKGFSAEMRMEIRQQQLAQATERQVAAAREAAANEEYAQQQNQFARIALLRERQDARNRRKSAEENVRANLQPDNAPKVAPVMQNQIDDSFHRQFGTTCR